MRKPALKMPPLVNPVPAARPALSSNVMYAFLLVFCLVEGLLLGTLAKTVIDGNKTEKLLSAYAKVTPCH